MKKATALVSNTPLHDSLIRSHPVRLYYFGDRNYVDVSTLCRNFFTACGLNPDQPLHEYEAIRILKPIKNHGNLFPGTFKASSSLFAFSIDGVKYDFSYIEGETAITERKPEPTYSPGEYTIIDGKKGTFKTPLNNVMTYNLMVLGKVLIVANTDLIPRVVRTELHFNLRKDDYQHLTMEYIELKNRFVHLRSTIFGKHHSDVFVKLLETP